MPKRFLSLLMLLMLGYVPLAAQSPLPSLEPDPRAAEYGRRVRSGSPGWEDLAEIGIWASGGEAGPALMNGLRAAVGELAASLPKEKGEQGDYILTFMHRKFLKSYSALQTRVDTLLSSGRYNCVSSAVLYLVLAASVGLDVQGVMTKDHAFVSLNTPAGAVDVETTNPYGFDPGNRREFHDNFGTLTGFAYVPARNYRDRAAISPLELISLIFTNRISDLESRRRFAEAIPLALDRAALLAGRAGPSASPLFPDPEDFLKDRLLNYGASLVQGGREEEALRWSALAEPRFPGDPRWRELNEAALNNLLVRDLRAGRFLPAREALRRYAPLVSPAQAALLEGQILDGELFKRSQEAQSAAAVEAVLGSLREAEPYLEPARIGELRTFLLLKGGELRAKEAGWAAGAAYAQGAISRYGPNRRLEDQLRQFQSNRAAELHNAFAAAYNRRDFAEARRIIQGALEEFPGHRQLREDRDMAERALGGR